MKIVGAAGSLGRRKNPKATRVARCVKSVKARQKKRGAKRVDPYAVCQKATRQSYRTGRLINPGYAVAVAGGKQIAVFKTLPTAKEYARALATKTGRRVGILIPHRHRR